MPFRLDPKKYSGSGKIAFYHGKDDGIGGLYPKGENFKNGADKVAPHDKVDINSSKDIDAYFDDKENKEKIKNYGLKYVYILDHGSCGCQNVGSDFSQLGEKTILKIAEALKKNGILVLCGCNIAEGDEGAKYMKNLSKKFPKIKIAAADCDVNYSWGTPGLSIKAGNPEKNAWEFYQDGKLIKRKEERFIIPHKK